MTMMNICNCECDVISTIEYWWSELNISKQSYSRPEMRRNVRGSASFPSTVATASPSLLVLIGGLRLRHVSSIETGCWVPYLPIYTILSSSITHVPIEFSFCLECFSSGQKILQSQYSTTNCWDVFSLLTKFWNRYKSLQYSFWEKLIWTNLKINLNTKSSISRFQSTITRLDQSDVVSLQHDPSKHLRTAIRRIFEENNFGWLHTKLGAKTRPSLFSSSGAPHTHHPERGSCTHQILK